MEGIEGWKFLVKHDLGRAKDSNGTRGGGHNGGSDIQMTQGRRRG